MSFLSGPKENQHRLGRITSYLQIRLPLACSLSKRFLSTCVVGSAEARWPEFPSWLGQ